MPDEREFKIKITTQADSSGAKQEAAELNNLSAATKRYINDLKSEEDSLQETLHSKKELKEIIRDLKQEVPELGMMGRFLFNPWTASLGLSLFFLGKVREHYSKLREAVESKIDLSSMQEFTDALGKDAMLKALIDAGTASDLFWDKLSRLSAEQENLRDKTTDAVDAINKQADAEKKQLDAQERRDLAQVDAEEKAGTISSDEAARRKTRIREKYDAGRESVDADRDKAAIEAKKQERTGQQKIVDAGRESVGAKQQAAAEAQADLEKAKAGLEEWSKKAKEISEWLHGKGKDADAKTYMEQVRAKGQAEGKIAEYEQDTVPTAQRRATNTREALESERRKVEEATRRRGELDREIGRMEADSARDAGTRQAVNRANRQATEFEEQGRYAGSSTGKLIQNVAGAESAMQHGEKISVKQQAEINKLTAMLQGQHMNADAILKALGQVHGNTDLLTKRVADLAKRLEQQGQQIRNGHNP